jgi:hypothetical protein
VTKADQPDAIGFHEFFRYAIPGYGFLTVALITAWTGGLKSPFSDIQNVVAALVGGPFIGFVIHYGFYYPIWTWYYTNYSSTYKEVTAIVKSVPKLQGSELSRGKSDKLLARCIWDVVYFLDENREQRDRIQFLLTIMHSIGATLFSIWLGFLAGLTIPSFIIHAEIDFQTIQKSLELVLTAATKWYWLVLLGTLIITSILLFMSFKDRKHLAEKQEYLLVLKSRRKIQKEVLRIDIKRPSTSKPPQ